MSQSDPNPAAPAADGIHAMLPPDRMPPHVRKYRLTLQRTPGLGFFQKEFGFFCLDRWHEEGLPEDADMAETFSYDPAPDARIRGLGWTEPNYFPKFPEQWIEDRGEHEVIQDICGRKVLYFKGRRSGFMPTYLDHPVKDMETWERDVRWRMDPTHPERLAAVEANLPPLVEAARQGYFIIQRLVGGYMYLRAIMGPEEVLYKFLDDPDLIHACMRQWFETADAIIAIYQRYVTLDQLFIGEDICYNGGPLISPDMIREFLFPYYQQLLQNIRRRQPDPARHLSFHVDTDGDCRPVIELYRELGMDMMSPFEVASGCDVVEIGKRYPWLVLSGGVDKRILAEGPDAIDRMVDRIFPAMKERGGYIPTCDHGVPEEVSLANYRHYRNRCLEFRD